MTEESTPKDTGNDKGFAFGMEKPEPADTPEPIEMEDLGLDDLCIDSFSPEIIIPQQKRIIRPTGPLTYEDLVFPNYINSKVAVKLNAEIDGKPTMVELTVSDIVFAAEIAGLNMAYISDTGLGKSQLMKDLAYHHFGGNGRGGNSNYVVARPDFEIEDLLIRTIVDLGSGKYDSREVRMIDHERARRVFWGVDEINRAPNERQNDFIDLATGERSFDGLDCELGCDGYSIFVAAKNMNRLNGAFQGVTPTDRALLSRMHITIDMDHHEFRPTPEDEMEMERREITPKVARSAARDISHKIMAENKKLIEEAKGFHPYFSAFRFLIGRAMHYCAHDRWNEKGEIWPSDCMDCGESDNKKTLCSRIKANSGRTVKAMKLMSHSLSYIASLKAGRQVDIDPFDLALQAFRFTTFHENINEVMVMDEYTGRHQIMMDDTVKEMAKRTEIVEKYIPAIEAGFDAIIAHVRPENGEPYYTVPRESTKTKLETSGTPYTIVNLRDELRDAGIGNDWVDTYVKECKAYYRARE